MAPFQSIYFQGINIVYKGVLFAFVNVVHIHELKSQKGPLLLEREKIIRKLMILMVLTNATRIYSLYHFNVKEEMGCFVQM